VNLAPGTRIGPYEIVAPLGAGGMGEVHRARDARLGRDVAIKALPEALAHDAERVARFEREARLLASLNHPNIGAIHGLEEAGGHRYLVLEFVDGETLAQRLRRGALPVREALTVCRAIAGALEAAHESGVIHRDLKPGNVMVRGDGEVKVLDFGLAKGGAAGSSTDAGLSASPTITYAATGVGIVLGTAAYMSPEQARGKTVDRRTDIWSFGCVLYECLTGRQVFEGETVSDVIARILEREPDWNALPPALSPAVRELLQRCLDKDAKQRLRDIGDARLVLEKELAGGSGGVRASAAASAPARAGRGVMVAALGAGLVAGAALWAALGPRLAPAGAGLGGSTHLSIALSDDPRVYDMTIAPDGLTLAFRGLPAALAEQGDDAARLYVRRLDDFQLRELPGTAGLLGFRFTPDGRSLIFRGPLGAGSTQHRLARVPVDGSIPPVTLATWNPLWSSLVVLRGGDILAADREGSRVFRIPAAGGAAREQAIDRGGMRGTITLDQALPDDRGVLATAGVYRDRGWSAEAAVVDLRANRLTLLEQKGGNLTYLADGTLLLARGEVLLAAPFDLGRLALRAAPVPVATGLRAPFSYSPGSYDVGGNGTLYYPPGGEVGNARRLGIVDAAGRLRVLPAEPHPFQGWPSASKDGMVFGVRATNAAGLDEIWIGNRDRPTLRRLVSWPEADCVSLFMSPDGRSVAYGRIGRDELDGVYVADVHGAGPGRRVVVQDSTLVSLRPEGWSPDGAWLVLSREAKDGGADLWVARLNAARDSALVVKPLLELPGDQEASDFSPDGQWLAFENDETGRKEVFVAPFRADGSLGPLTRITEQGGIVPEWLPGGRRLSIRDQTGRRTRILEVGSPPGPPTAPPQEWFDGAALGVLDGGILNDGGMIVILRGPQETDGMRSINAILGWTRGLKQRMAAAR